MKTFFIFLAISLGIQSSWAQNTPEMCRARLFKRLTGTATGSNDPRLANDIDQRVEAACQTRNFQNMFQVAHEITGSDRYLHHIIKPFTYFISDRYNDPNGDLISQGTALMYYFTATNKSLRENLFSFNKMPIGNRGIHNEFTPPCTTGAGISGCLNNTGFKTTNISLSLSTGNHSLVHQLYEQGQCNIQVFNDPLGSQPNACYELADVPQNQNFSQIANTGPNDYIPNNKRAGIMTLPHDTYSRNVFLMGTNRRAVAHAFETLMCTPLKLVRNSSLPDTWVRRDVARAPAGSIATYQNVCKGCHAGLDAMANAFVAFEWVDIDALKQGLITRYAPNQGNFTIPANTNVVRKINQNNGNPGLNIPFVPDDTWRNLWHDDPKLGFGWKEAFLDGNPVDIRQGNGPRELGVVLTHSEAFANCMPERFFKLICGRELTSEEKGQFISDIRSVTDSNDTLKNYGAAVAAHPACTGGQ